MFNEKHKRAGIVTNQPGTYDRDRPHASTVVCDLEECRAKAIRYVAGVTNETAVYVADKR